MTRILPLFCILLLLGGCEEEYTGPAGGGAGAGAGSGPASSQGSSPAADLEIVADDAADPTPPFIYQYEGLRDPFEPFIVALTDNRDKASCPLCLDVSELRLVGLVTGVASPVAVIETRDGLGYFVRRGSEIGAHGGRVIDIRDGRVLVRERLQDQLGRISIVDRTLSLRSTASRSKDDKGDGLTESTKNDEPLSASTPDAEIEELMEGDEDEDEDEDEETSDDEDLED